MINSLGTVAARASYRERLQQYFRAHESELDADSRRRLDGNALRILDSKQPAMRALIEAAPLLTEHLDPESQAHFAGLRAGLDAVGVAYEVNPRLVRGLDYYSRTVFEWVTDALGAQDAVCSGGRYDGLITQLGGEATPAIGFAMGIERTVELMNQAGNAVPGVAPDIYIVASGERSEREAMRLAEQLRDALPGRGVLLNLGGGNFKTQFRRADRSGARLALILGDAELDRGVAAVKPLRRDDGQIECPLHELPARIAALL
jgi:histidyl-tRNA synthetase